MEKWQPKIVSKLPLLREWMMFPRHYLERFLYSTHLFIFTNVYFDYRSGRVSFRLYFINYSQVAHNGSRFLFLFFYPKHFFAVLSRLYCSLYLIYFLTYMFFVIFRIFPWLFLVKVELIFPFVVTLLISAYVFFSVTFVFFVFLLFHILFLVWFLTCFTHTDFLYI